MPSSSANPGTYDQETPHQQRKAGANSALGREPPSLGGIVAETAIRLFKPSGAFSTALAGGSQYRHATDPFRTCVIGQLAGTAQGEKTGPENRPAGWPRGQ
jgi:hypothetical protein